jgi:hypothetical protein
MYTEQQVIDALIDAVDGRGIVSFVDAELAAAVAYLNGPRTSAEYDKLTSWVRHMVNTVVKKEVQVEA